MSKVWREPLDVRRHFDHFLPGAGARPRSVSDGHERYSYFVRVCGFTFEFASRVQLRDTLAFFEKRIHESSRQVVFEPEKGEWQRWHERLPAFILKSSRRERVLKALRYAVRTYAQ